METWSPEQLIHKKENRSGEQKQEGAETTHKR
jgi:hypothetical protein